MRVLVACEESGRVRDALIARGHDAISADILPTSAPGPHHQGDVLPLLRERWDLVIAFPPCTDLSQAQHKGLDAKIEDGRTQKAFDFFMACYNANAPKVCVENPLGIPCRWFRKPDQWVQPWMWGEPWQKRTGLWLRGLPPLVAEFSKPAERLPSWVAQKGGAVGAWSKKERSKTFQGLANAMAAQWGINPACRTGCKTQDHVSYAECLRGAAIQIGNLR